METSYIHIHIYIYEYTRNRNGFRNGHFLLRSIPTRRMIVCFPRTIYRGNDRLIPCTLSFSYYCTVAVDALHFISNLFQWNKRGTRSATVVVLHPPSLEGWNLSYFEAANMVAGMGDN